MSLIKVALDNCLSPRLAEVLNTLYKHKGFDFMHVEQFAESNAPDEIWAELFTRFGGKFVISGDTRIAYRPHQALAFKENKLVAVFPSEEWTRLKIHHHATVLPFYWPAIEAKFMELADSDGSCWRLKLTLRNGELTLTPAVIEALEIPESAIEQARIDRDTIRAVRAHRT